MIHLDHAFEMHIFGSGPYTKDRWMGMEYSLDDLGPTFTHDTNYLLGELGRTNPYIGSLKARV